MKKVLSIGLIALFIFGLTGCGNDNSGTLTCTKTETNEEGYATEETMIVTYKDNIVTNVEATAIEEMDTDLVDMTVSFGQLFATSLNEVNGLNVSYEKESDSSVKYIMSVDFQTLDLDALRETFGEDFDDDSFYANNNITIDEFREENLSDYNCN